MKIKLLIVSMLFFVFSILAATGAEARYTRGYYRKSGTYVKPYHSTNSNYTKRDNYSYRGNTNPYTGKKGYSR